MSKKKIAALILCLGLLAPEAALYAKTDAPETTGAAETSMAADTEAPAVEPAVQAEESVNQNRGLTENAASDLTEPADAGVSEEGPVIRMTFLTEDGTPVEGVGVSVYRVADKVVTDNPEDLSGAFKDLYHQASVDVEKDRDAPNYSDPERQFAVVLDYLADAHNSIRPDMHRISDSSGTVSFAFGETNGDDESTWLIREDGVQGNAALYDRFEPFLAAVPGRTGDRVEPVRSWQITLYTPDAHVLTDQNEKATFAVIKGDGGKTPDFMPREGTVTAEAASTESTEASVESVDAGTNISADIPVMAVIIILLAAAAGGGVVYIARTKKKQEKENSDEW